ncbi:hypothetical protein D7Y21_10285 [Corallococcus sp. AB045]|uniref:hypothetical protein n=1 Tax=Corallococcus sp. AB045 TaxID=2316719 RepID=UPI000ECDCEE9|nr:hypothetical protein [Corallococcus sp. AB045]RKH89521.1 hypothetical protein D7Y21_10285 [Corallococcus sp. AB045]
MAPSLKSYAFSLATVLCLSACGEDPNGYSLRFSLHSNRVRAARDPMPPPEYAFESSDGLTFHVDSVLARLSDIRLELPPGIRCADQQGLLSPRMTCEDATEEQPGRLTVAGPLEWDLRQGLSLDAAGLRIPRGVYPRIEARLERGTPSHPTFQSRSSFTWQGMASVLDADFQSDAVLRFEPQGGEGSLDFASAEDGSVLWGWLVVDRWLDEVPVAGCLESGDLSLLGNSLTLEAGQGACAGASERMRGNIEASGAMGLSLHP